MTTLVRCRPIIFSGDSVRAIIDGRKTQTRRVMKPQPYVSDSNPPTFRDAERGDLFVCPDLLPTTERRGFVIAECEGPGQWHCMGQRQFADKHCPYGVPGDRLWVKEATITDSCGGLIGYRADGCDKTEHWERRRSSLMMPRAWARLTLEVVSVRVERVQAISEADAIAEGFCRQVPKEHDHGSWLNDSQPIDAFARTWDALNAKRGHSWAANPWVLVIEFRKI